MLVNLENLSILNTALRASFQKGFSTATDDHLLIATQVPSNTRSNTYPWLGAIPRMREWVGDRQIKQLTGQSYALENKDWELTIEVERKDIEDDQYGVYSPMAEGLGMEAKEHRSRLVFELLANGAAAGSLCYDGKPFFATNHQDEEETPQSNYTSGANPSWILLDTTKPLRPMIFQMRKEIEMVAKTNLSDDRVFFEKKFTWGVDGRYAAGFGFWQTAYLSKAELNETNLSAARAAMRKFTDSEGRRLNIRPNLLLVGPDLETTAEKLIVNVLASQGETNVMRGKFQYHVSPYL